MPVQKQGGGKHCQITTNKSCRRCNFYQPTTQAVFEACYSEIAAARDLVNTANTHMEAIKDARLAVAEYAACAGGDYQVIKEAAAKMSLSSDIVTTALWVDSVNSYE